MNEVATQHRAVTTRTTSQEAAEVVRNLIHSGELVPGDRLPAERELARQLQIARPTLREALKVLSFEGYVRTRRGAAGGTFIADLGDLQESWMRRMAADLDTLDDILDFRVAAESHAAQLAAVRRTDEDIAVLDAAVAAMAALDSTTRFRRTDAEFHRAVAQAARSPRLGDAMDSGRAEMFLPVDRLVREYRVQDTLDAHRAVLEAIRGGDGEAARLAMAAHIEHTRVELRAVLDDVL